MQKINKLFTFMLLLDCESFKTFFVSVYLATTFILNVRYKKEKRAAEATEKMF